MRNIKIIVLLMLFLVTLNIIACANNKVNDCYVLNSCIKTGESTITTTSKSMKFDYILDEFIKDNDPRIQSLLTIARENTGSKIEISYFNYDGKQLSERLYNIFKANNLLVDKPNKYDPNSADIPSKILVAINFSNKKFNSSSTKGT